jgi:valyl-tRNA synthetase
MKDKAPPDLDDAINALARLIDDRERHRKEEERAVPLLTDVVEEDDGEEGDGQDFADEDEGEGDDEDGPHPTSHAGVPVDAWYPKLVDEMRRVVAGEIARAVADLRSSLIKEVRAEFGRERTARLTAQELKAQEMKEALAAEPVHPGHPVPAVRAATREEETPAPAEIDKVYNPHEIEQPLYERWEKKGYFRPAKQGKPYCIMLPPPNVTGSLHMGHAFQDTLMDALCRFKRMQGYRVLWQCGTDHAGIATQMVVERQLGEQGRSREEMGREAFVEAVWDWKGRSGGTITRQLRRMGASMDWSRERFTLDPGLSKAVTEVFVRLYEEGLLYRGKRLVNWDPVLETAISDLEVVSKEESGHLWHIRYPLADGSGHLTVATTRPETMLGDTAVAVHPNDQRYRHLVGREVELPLTGCTIPIIADDYVDPEFGSGCVKITPAHDFNDYDVGERHGLPKISVLTKRGHINDNAPGAYVGLDRFEARKRIVEDLEAAGLLARIEDHKLMVPRGDRSGAVVEPLLTDQWFVRAKPLAESAIKVVEDGLLRFVPENWAKTYFEWLRNIEDWCVSRQIWWGHQIPAWYDEFGNVHVGHSEAEIRAREELPPDLRLTRDPDVLDTWFSSALWPFSTLGWPEDTQELKDFYPTNVLVTGFDIIFFWVARMVMMGWKFMGDVPFTEVYIHGLVRDAEGQKMSKSKGNILDPLDLIDGIDIDDLVAKRTTGLMRSQDVRKIERDTRKLYPKGIPSYGTDALRFTFASLATQGRDVRFDLGRIEGYRNFCNKLWNAARYVLLATRETGRGDSGKAGLPERWIRARLQQTIRTVTEAFDHYRFDLAAQAIYEFVWDEYCDWYLELSKVVLNDPGFSAEARSRTRRTLLEVLETILRLAHPLIPFITEEIWSKVAPRLEIRGETLMLERYPEYDADRLDAAALREMEWVKTFTLGVRRIRAEMNVPPGKPLLVLVRGGTTQEAKWLQDSQVYLRALARIHTLSRLKDNEESPGAAAALAGEMTILIPLADMIDPEAELERLNKEIARLAEEYRRSSGKLDNPSFVERAPAEVVDKERARCEELAAAIERLEESRDKIAALC